MFLAKGIYIHVTSPWKIEQLWVGFEQSTSALDSAGKNVDYEKSFVKIKFEVFKSILQIYLLRSCLEALLSETGLKSLNTEFYFYFFFNQILKGLNFKSFLIIVFLKAIYHRQLPTLQNLTSTWISSSNNRKL